MSEGSKVNINKEKARIQRKKLVGLEGHAKSLEQKLAKANDDLGAANKRIKEQEDAIIEHKVAIRDLEAEAAENVKTIERQAREIKVQREELSKPPKTIVVVSPVPVLSVKYTKSKEGKEKVKVKL